MDNTNTILLRLFMEYMGFLLVCIPLAAPASGLLENISTSAAQILREIHYHENGTPILKC